LTLPPHGGVLVNRQLSDGRREAALSESRELLWIHVSDELIRDIENIATGAFSPLEGFMNRNEFDSVVHKRRLTNDLAWTIPIVLDVPEKAIANVSEGDRVVIACPQNVPAALLDVEEIFPYDKRELAQQVYGTLDPEHPGVAKTYAMNDQLIGGKLSLIRLCRDEFERFRLKPMETRVLFKEKDWRSVVGFQTRNIPHLGHEYVQKTALTFVDGLFINPVIGRKKTGDFKDEVILAAYEALMRGYYLRDRAVMSVLRTEMRYAGPKEAVFHAIVRKNFGCTHFVVGRDHAGVGKYYAPYAAQEIFDEFPDLGIVPLFFKSFFYCERCGGVVNEKTCPHDLTCRIDFSGTRLRQMLSRGEPPPKEFVRSEVADVLLKWRDPFVE
jgi:sulfate adenylyltransferase